MGSCPIFFQTYKMWSSPCLFISVKVWYYLFVPDKKWDKPQQQSFFGKLLIRLFRKTDTHNKYTFTIKMFRLRRNIQVYIADRKCKQQSFLRKICTSWAKIGPVPRPCGVSKKRDVEHILRIDARVSQGKKPRHTLGSDLHQKLTFSHVSWVMLFFKSCTILFVLLFREDSLVHSVSLEQALRQCVHIGASGGSKTVSASSRTGHFSYRETLSPEKHHSSINWSHTSLCLCPGRLLSPSPWCTWGRCVRSVSVRTA